MKKKVVVKKPVSKKVDPRDPNIPERAKPKPVVTAPTVIASVMEWTTFNAILSDLERAVSDMQLRPEHARSVMTFVERLRAWGG